MGLSSFEALLTEVKVSTHLAVVARAVNGGHLAPATTVEGGKGEWELGQGVINVVRTHPNRHHLKGESRHRGKRIYPG